MPRVFDNGKNGERPDHSSAKCALSNAGRIIKKMPNIPWELSRFIGMHSQKTKVENGELYASDMKNLRIDENGWLRLRSDISAIGPADANITGIAASQKHLFVLRADGKLYLREAGDLANETIIPGVSDLEGRISVVGEFRDYFIITSEGEDQGFIVDLREDKELRAYPLGFDPPTFEVIRTLLNEPRVNLFSFDAPKTEHGYLILITDIANDPVRYIAANAQPGVNPSDYLDSTKPARFEGLRTFIWDGKNQSGRKVANGIYQILLQEVHNVTEDTTIIDTTKVGVPRRVNDNYLYFYRFTYLREAPGELLDTMESNPSDPVVVDVANHTRVQFGNFSFNNDDGLETHIAIYRSARILRADYYAGEIDLHAQDHGYKRVGTVQRSTSNPRGVEGDFFYDYLTPHLGIDLRFDNDRMPATVKQLTEYNNIIFGAAGERLVYSDIRSGNLTPWAFPVLNEIRVAGRVDFCVELREVFMFGGNAGIWRLTGITELDYRVGNIGIVGPVGPHAFGKTLDGFAFVGEGGLYLSGGSSANKVSAGVLDGLFENKRVRRGAAVLFKDGDILFSVGLSDIGSDTITDVQFKYDDGYWVRWEAPFVQGASLVDGNVTRVFVADGTGQTKEIKWNETTPEDEITEWSWTSHFLDIEGAMEEKDTKRFKEFTFVGAAENEMKLETWVNDDSEAPTEHAFVARSESLRSVRVPINRRARRLKFRLSGTGNCKIQGMAVKIHT